MHQFEIRNTSEVSACWAPAFFFCFFFLTWMIKSREEEEDYILTPLCRSPVSPQCEERGRGKEERRVPPPLICPSIHPDIYLSIHPSVRLSILTGRSRWAQSGGQRSLRSEGEEEDEDDDHDGDQHADGTPLSATWDTHTHTHTQADISDYY